MADPVRCAIYTRKSTEEGLEQEFNSLDAQREACAAYILSQKHEGWSANPEIYDDGGFSGGSMQRPGLVQLMADVAAGKVNIIVVYKVDRLTRSLADFARIVDVLDAASASFVSVTQSFNTTTSMGRLTLNVLLSFAQFEREVTGERIRDKIAASKRKGMWMGGPVPLGYDVIDRKLVVNEVEAAQVRHIVHRYLEVGSVRLMVDELAAAGFRTKLRPLRNGSSIGGVAFSRGGLLHLLSNCVYIGEVRHKGATYDGAHDPIIDREVWDRVQAALADKAPARTRRANIRHPSILVGLVLDGHGRKMTPSHAVKQAKRYRYYMTRDRQPGTPAMWRVPAHDLEQLVIARLCRHLVDEREVDAGSSLGAHDDAERHNTSTASSLMESSGIERTDLIRGLVERIDVRRDCVELTLRPVGEEASQTLTAAATLIRSGRQTRLVPPGIQMTNAQVPDKGLTRLVANAHAARLAVAEGGDQPVDVIAEEYGFTAHYFAQLVRLGGLAPDIVTAILEGRQPANLTRTRLARTKALPLDWNEQRQIFLFMMPGDFIVPGLFELEACDLVSLTPLRTVDATPLVDADATITSRTGALIADSCRYYRILLLDHLTRLTLGCTTSAVAHLLTEFHTRSLRSGGCTDGRFSLPIGQRVLAFSRARSAEALSRSTRSFNSSKPTTCSWSDMTGSSCALPNGCAH